MGMLIGETLTQNTWATPNDATAVSDSKTKMFNKLQVYNQHVRNFGVGDPMNHDGVTDQFTSIKGRMDLMRAPAGGQKIVLTAAVCPWVWNNNDGQYPTPDSTKNANNTAPVYPATGLQEPQKFADMMGRIITYLIAQYGGHPVYAVQVWNEFKGMFNGTTHAWDNARYIDLFNRCYTAIKAADSTVLVGGPYAIISGPYAGAIGGGHPQKINGIAAPPLTIGTYGNVDLIGVDSVDYFVRHASAYDFICWDGRTKDGTTGVTTDPVNRAAAYYGTVTDRLLSVIVTAGGSAATPLWCSEFHAGPSSGGALSDATMAQCVTSGFTAAEAAGLDLMLLWGDEAVDPVNAPGIWTPVANPGGGQPTATGQAVLDYLAISHLSPRVGGSGFHVPGIS